MSISFFYKKSHNLYFVAKNKDQHYVTAQYLNLWAKAGLIVQYDLLKKTRTPANPKTACKEKYLYVPDHVADNQKLLLENFFGKIESDGMPVIYKIVEAQPITKDDRDKLALFIAIHRLRTLRGLEDHEKITFELEKRRSLRLLNNPQKLKEFVDELTLKKVHDIEKIQQNPKDYFQSIWKDVDDGKLKLKIKNNRQMWLPVMFKLIVRLAEQYANGGWYLLKANEKSSFITSDDPIIHLSCFADSSSIAKSNVREIEVAFPLSPKRMLIMRLYEKPSFRYLDSYEHVSSAKELNIRILSHANSYMFSDNEKLGDSLVKRFHTAWQHVKSSDNIASFIDGQVNTIGISKDFPIVVP
jgi:hypothetical protein